LRIDQETGPEVVLFRWDSASLRQGGRWFDQSPDQELIWSRRCRQRVNDQCVLDDRQKSRNKTLLQEVSSVVKQVVASNGTHTQSMQRSPVVLSWSVHLRRLGPSFSPEAGAAFCRL